MADTEFVSVGAFVAYVGEVLGRGHSLFADPPDSGAPAATGAGHTLDSAGKVVRTALGRVDGLSGGFPASYGDFAGRAAPALDGLAGLDANLGGALTDAAGTDRDGRRQSGAVVDGAAADTDVLAPWSGTPAGQKVLLTQLRGRLASQQQVIAAFKARDARLAALMRSMAYRSRLGGRGQIPLSAPNFGSPAGLSGSPLSPLSGLSGLGGAPGALVARGRDRPGGRLTTVPDIGPVGRLTMNSGPHDVARAIIAEARRRGYPPQETIAILADAMQESGLSPRAVSPNGKWRNIFQQDSSYPGRDDPNTAISEFFNRYDAKRRSPGASPDFWKNIFWLQQAPGLPSAQAAWESGRQAYLTEEVQRQHPAAERLFYELTSAGAGAAV